MKTKLTATRIALTAALLSVSLAAPARQPIPELVASRPASALRPVSAQWLSANPKGFLPNVGQLPNVAMKYVLRDRGVSAYFSDRGFVLWNGQTTTISRDGTETKVPVAPRWEIVGAKPITPTGADALPHTVSFFRGNDHAYWHANVPAYRELRYPEILNGVELRVESRQRGFEYSFHVKPHARPELRFRYEGITALEKSALGDLVVRTAKGHFTESRPVSYQLIEGTRYEVESSFELVSANEYCIAIGDYDERLELVIDPVLDWSTFVGAANMERLRSVKVDPVGDLVVIGDAYSTDLPDTGFSTGPGETYDAATGQWYEDAIVAKLSPDGTQLRWLGYLAGVGKTSDTVGFKGLAVDGAGDVYVGGFTWSPDFPTTTGPAHSGASDAFVTKIRGDGSAIVWSRLLGGTSDDWGWGIALDTQANVYFTGFTLSANFPTLNAFDTTLGGTRDAFVTKLDPSGTVLWSSYLGGSGEERVAALLADANGDVIVFGDTGSSDFPVTAGAYDTTLGGSNDAFVTKLAGDDASIVWSTYLGGSGLESDLGVAGTSNTWYLNWGHGDITLDSVGNILVGGQTFSADFPTTAGAFKRTRSGNSDGYVAKLTPTGNQLLWSTYLGGSGAGAEREDIVWGLAVNPWDEVFVVGRTDSSNFPVTTGALQTKYRGGGQDGFLTKLSPNGSTLLYSTYLGSSQADVALGLAYDSGEVLVTGWVSADDYPVTAGAYQTDNASWPSYGTTDGYVMKFLDAFLAQDGFESNNYTGGTGWAGAWTVSGDTSILNSAGPHSGSRHVRLRSSTGYLRRAVNVPPPAVTMTLGFWSKVDSFEGGDKAYVRVKKSTAATFTTVATFTPAQSDNKYHYYEVDLSGFLPATQLQVEFDAEMNASNDNWYLDDIRFTGME